MKLRSVKIERRFVPKWEGNRDLQADEQVVIHFSRIPGTTEKSNYKGFTFEQQGGVKLVHNDNMLVSAFVERIDNLSFDDGTKIKNGRDLATAVHPKITQLVEEIREYLFPEDEEFSEGESEA